MRLMKKLKAGNAFSEKNEDLIIDINSEIVF